MDVAGPVTVRSFRFLCAVGHIRSVSYSGIVIRNWPVHKVPFRAGLTLSWKSDLLNVRKTAAVIGL
jgi:hypothetical protein